MLDFGQNANLKHNIIKIYETFFLAFNFLFTTVRGEMSKRQRNFLREVATAHHAVQAILSPPYNVLSFFNVVRTFNWGNK